MIYGSNNIFAQIEECLKEVGIKEDVELRYSNLDGVDIQCNTLLRVQESDVLNNVVDLLLKTLLQLDEVENVEITDKYFINIRFSNYYFENFTKFDKANLISSKAESILIDYGGPNIGKDLHVGHIRTLNLGRSLYKINELAGNDITSDIHFGDWGMPVALIIAYGSKENLDLNSITYNDLELIYPLANKLAKEDEEFYSSAKNISKELNLKNVDYIKLWRIIYDLAIPNIKNLLFKLGHEFDWYFGESDVVDEVIEVVEKAKKENKVVEDGGAFVSNEKNDPPILITKSDGSFLYLTTDLGTVLYRERKQDFDKYIYVVDNRQKNHFEQLFSTVKFFDISDKTFLHVGFGTVNGPGNKPFKTRDGGVYKLEFLYSDIQSKLQEFNSDLEVLDILTNTVITYSDLLSNRLQNYIFDIDKFTDINGKTGIYIQYSQVRAKKILSDIENSSNNFQITNLNSDERELCLLISKFTYFFNLSLKNNEPHHLAEYAFNLCQSFNTFYARNKILSNEIGNEEKEKRILIVQNFHDTLLVVLTCLGIKPVPYM